MCLLVCDPAGPRAVPAARGAVPQPTPEPVKLKAAANSLQRVLETVGASTLASPGPLPGALPTAACSQLLVGLKAGTLMNLLVAHSPLEEFLAGRGCPRFPHASQGRAGAGWSRGMCPQQL